MFVKEWLPWLPAAALGLVVMVAPLPFGGVVPEAAAWLEAAAFVVLALTLVATRDRATERRVFWPVWALAGLALWGFLQSAPLPEAVVAVVSPEQIRLRSELAVALPLEANAARPALSVAPEVSRAVALHLLSLAALWAAGVLLGPRRGCRRVVALGLATAVAVELVIGFESWMAGSKLIWGRLVQTDGLRLHGTFVNPNHFALFLELGLMVALAWVWWSFRRARDLAALENRVLLAGPPVLVWLALFVAVAFTGSRAGLLAAIGGTLVQAAALWFLGRRRPASALAIGALTLAGVSVVAWVGWRQGFGRWIASSSTSGLASRTEVYEASLELWQRFPFVGSGLGTFREAFGLVQPASLAGSWWHAHSDWLELVVTAGLIGLALAAFGVLSLLRRLLKVLRQGRRSEDRAAALAALGAVAAAGLHEMVDFGLTMPANALTLVVVLSLASAAATERPDRSVTGGRRAFLPVGVPRHSASTG